MTVPLLLSAGFHCCFGEISCVTGRLCLNYSFSPLVTFKIFCLSSCYGFPLLDVWVCVFIYPVGDSLGFLNMWVGTSCSFSVDLPPYCSLFSLWISVRSWPYLVILTLFSMSQLLPCIFCLLAVWAYSVEFHFPYHSAHSFILRWYDLLVSMSIELLLSRIVFFIFKGSVWFFFRSSRFFFIVYCSFHDISFSFISLNIE